MDSYYKDWKCIATNEVLQDDKKYSITLVTGIANANPLLESLKENGHRGCCDYLCSGGDGSLVLSNEFPEDDPLIGAKDLEEKLKEESGEIVYIGAYYRGHYYEQVSQYRVYDQSGTIYVSWIDFFEGEDTYYSGPQYPWYQSHQDSLGRTYWIESWRRYPLTLPADTSAMGDWKIEIDFEGVTYEQSFNVGYTDLLIISAINILESAGDYDQVINPGESIDIIFNINNFTLLNLVNLSGAIDCDSEDIIINNNIYYNSILSGESITNSDQPFSLSIPENIEFGEYDCNINLIYYNELDEE